MAGFSGIIDFTGVGAGSPGGSGSYPTPGWVVTTSLVASAAGKAAVGAHLAGTSSLVAGAVGAARTRASFTVTTSLNASASGGGNEVGFVGLLDFTGVPVGNDTTVEANVPSGPFLCTTSLHAKGSGKTKASVIYDASGGGGGGSLTPIWFKKKPKKPIKRTPMKVAPPKPAAARAVAFASKSTVKGRGRGRAATKAVLKAQTTVQGRARGAHGISEEALALTLMLLYANQ